MSSVALHEPALDDLDRPAPPPKYQHCRWCGSTAVATCDALVGEEARVCGRAVCGRHRTMTGTFWAVNGNGRAALDSIDYCPTHSSRG